VLPASATAKEPRSASVKHEFQLTHPCPSTGLTSGACPGYIKDHIVPLASDSLAEGSGFETEFAADSPLERNGFELPVPRQIGNGFEASSKWGRSTVGPTVSSEQLPRRRDRHLLFPLPKLFRRA
jgi:hypothetical protein